MAKDYVIYAPKYSKSNGVRVLYKLAECLSERGFNAYVYAVPDKNLGYNYIDTVTDNMRKNAVAIYPEVVSGNPLQFQNVVRYVLYFPGKLGGKQNYANYEKLFTFNRKYKDDCPVLGIPTIDAALFYSDDTPKDTDAYFVYKGGKWKDVPEFADMVEINSEYPPTRKELADLLRRTRTLYSYDRHTALLDEAAKCGCKVKIVTPAGFEDYQSNYDADFAGFDKQLQDFINETQSMDYQGEIEHLPRSHSLYVLKAKAKAFLYTHIIKNDKRALSHWRRSKDML